MILRTLLKSRMRLRKRERCEAPSRDRQGKGRPDNPDGLPAISL